MLPDHGNMQDLGEQKADPKPEIKGVNNLVSSVVRCLPYLPQISVGF